MSDQVLDQDRFVCSSGKECKDSVPVHHSFTEGQLSHVGKHYNLSREGRPLRIVVVGQEVGGRGRAHTTMEERYRVVHDGSGLNRRFKKEREFRARNPHMRGTTLALRLVLCGNSQTDHAGEFLLLNGKRVHIFDCFALVNRLLCSAHSEGSQGRATPTMWGNCERHFAATIRALRPTLVIVQGKEVFKHSRQVLLGSRELTPTLFECYSGGSPTTVCAFTHPSARDPYRWDSPHSPYFREVVRPTLRRALRRL